MSEFPIVNLNALSAAMNCYEKSGAEEWEVYLARRADDHCPLSFP